MNIKFLSTTAVIAILTATSSHAATLIDPFGLGDTGILGASITTTGQTSSLRVGSRGDKGTVEINADSSPNSITDVVATNSVNVGGFGDGLLRIVGDGTSESATLTTEDLNLGVGLNSVVEILDGGLITTVDSQIGTFTGSSVINIDGAGSELRITNGSLRTSGPGETYNGTISVTNGALIDINDDAGSRGDLLFSTNHVVTVQGTGSSIEFDGRTGVGGELNVIDGASLIDMATAPSAFAFRDSLTVGVTQTSTGFVPADASVLISTGASVELLDDVRIGGTVSFIDAVPSSDGESFDVIREGARGNVTVEENSTLTTNGTIYVSANLDLAELTGVDEFGNTGVLLGTGSGNLTVASGGVVTADKVVVSNGGTLNGDGGTINADVVLDGGTIAPGASPGIMSVNGDLNILNGLLQIEIAGTATGLFDQLFVSGDLIASSGFSIEINFLDSFVPQEGDVFNFLNVAGDSSIFDTPSLIDFTVNGGGFFGNDAQLSFAGGSLSLTDNASNVAPVPLPAGFPLLLVSLFGLGWAGKRHKVQTATS